jgi:hypothetical protein
MPRNNLQTPSRPVSLPEAAPDFNSSLKQMHDAFGTESPLGDLTPLPQSDAYAATVAREERRSKVSSGDILGSIVRQDSPVYGAVGALVAHNEFPTDPNFDALEPKGLAESMKGLPEEFMPYMARARSERERTYIRMQLDDKVADQQRLADLGVAGQAGRFLAGLVEPTNLAIGLVAPGASLLRMKPLATAAAGIGTGAAAGYGFERMRQAYTFEDSQPDAVWAGLMGSAFSAPFVGLHMREMSRVRSVARAELEAHLAAGAGEATPAAERALAEIAPVTKAHAEELTGFSPERENAPVAETPAVREPAKVPSADPLASPEATQPATRKATDVRWIDDTGEAREGRVMRDEGGTHLVVEDNESGRPVRVARSDLAEPELDGFLAGSVGGAQIAHTPVELTVAAKWRRDIFAQLNKSANPVVQRLGKMFVKDAINPSEFYAQGRAVSEDKRLLQRTVAGGFHYETASAYKDAATKMGLGPLARNSESHVRAFNQDVGRFIRDPGAYAGHPARAEIERAANAARKVYSTMLAEMQRAGVKGADTLAANPDYLNRVWLGDRIREMSAKHGEPEVHRLIATAIKDKQGILDRFRLKNPTSALTDAEVLAASAKKFVDSVMRLEHSHLSTELLLTATDAPTLRAELNKQLSSAQTESIIDHLFEVQEATSGDQGKPANLKYRFNLDEGAKITTKAGELSFSDLVENDARVLVDRYMNSMAGHVAMARQGIKSRAEFEALLREADQYHETANTMSKDAGRYAAENQMLRDVYNNIVGRPMSVHSFNTGDRIAATMRAYGRSVYLGQLGFTAMMETFHAAGLMTWRAAIQQMPSLMEFVRAARAGQRPAKGLADDVTRMLGNLNEHVSGYLRQHEITDFTYDKRLSGAEDVANHLSHAVDKFSGNSFTTALTRGMAAAGNIQKLVNFARGKTQLTEAWRTRLVGSGINRDDIDHVLSMLKDHAELDGNRVVGVKWEDWAAKDPKSYHDFVTAVDRDVRQGVQDHDLGETMMFQHTSIGKVFTELRAFNIAAHSKQFLNALHYRDATSLHLFTTSIISNGLAYVVQTSANFAHDPKELDKRLTAQRIAQAAYSRSAMMGIHAVPHGHARARRALSLREHHGEGRHREHRLAQRAHAAVLQPCSRRP